MEGKRADTSRTLAMYHRLYGHLEHSGIWGECEYRRSGKKKDQQFLRRLKYLRARCPMTLAA
ncbi:hypothetical protein RUM4293_02600 [Ruegeria atlantica]|uniref:Uncharacterized protein n=1 Tax=Ruegeria atlantica TaxID=81569 RepID=A0A0P1E795_9RHOB|nr:hypothetical protein RUM4293_02600 [Ruegeria atlantica]